MKDFVVNKLLDGKDEHKVRVTYSIVDHQLFFPISTSVKEKERIKLGYKPTDFIVGYVAAFNEKKAQLAFLEKLVVQFKSRSNILFCFIGDFNPDKSEYAKACLDIVKQLEIEDKVKFIGHVSNVDQFYKISDLSAIASNKEGLARCMIESISCGTPVISFDVCSAHEILTDHKCGEVAGMDNYDEYYQKMVKLIDDQPLLKRYGENGVALSNTLFDKKVVLSKYQEIY
jgi:glycosyltransferase involved in cell wall biosynthesis